MIQVNVHQAKTQLSRLLARVAAGEEVVIARADTPVARLVPVERPRRRRVPGRDKGKVWIADDFDAPLPPDVLSLMTADPELAAYDVDIHWAGQGAPPRRKRRR